MRIAIVDDLSTDAEALRKLLCRWASEQGIPLVPSPVILESGEALLAHFAPNAFDIIFLDIYMAGITGMEVARKIRELDTHCQLIFTTTTGEFAVDSYEVGAAYYLVKPFSYNELVSRAKALIRRYHVYQGKNMPVREAASKEGTAERIISYQDIVLNETRREVSRNGQAIELTDTEYALLHLLLTNRKQIFSAEHLYESIWQEEYYYGANNTVMVHMRNLRCKIEKDPKNPTIIKTVWGRGYRCD